MTDELGVPHVFAHTDLDAFRVQGYLHARDRFFQMDVNRRAADGRLAELTGNILDLAEDAGARLLGLRLAAQRSVDLLTARERALAEAYADGVNAYLASNPLPPEYSLLEISSVRPWDVVDILTLGKAGDAPSASRLNQIAETHSVLRYVGALGLERGIALYQQDVSRFAPMVPRASVPDAADSTPFLAGKGISLHGLASTPASAGALRFRARASPNPALSRLFERRAGRGSNVWGVAATRSASGRPMVANDGHLLLTSPAFHYENHLVVRSDPLAGPMNVTGVTSPGFPGVLSGQNPNIAWGVTTGSPDLSDIFRDRLVRGAPGCPVRLCIESAGELHAVEERSETYRFNPGNDGVFDNLTDATAAVRNLTAQGLIPEAVDVLTVPFRSFGPILEVEDPTVVNGGPATETTVLTLQYTGLHGTREARWLFNTLRARDIFEFREGVRFLTAIATHQVVADSSGNLAFFSTGEVPLRADLEAGNVAGAPPWFIRDGSGPNNWIPDPERSQGQVLPFRVLPFDEMPQVVNPAAGFIVNANEDPTGSVLDNDALNQFRPSNPEAIYYFGDFFNLGLRSGRVTRLLRERIEAGQEITLDDMMRFQANTQQLDAELLTPFLLQAFDKAQAPGVPPELGAFARDPEIAEAVGRLAVWDFSTPTGIPEGYDASDTDGVRSSDVSSEEAAHSVAATIYNVWRAKLIKNQIDGSLAALGLKPIFRNGSLGALHHLLAQEPFTGVGASGVDFFADPAGLPAEDRRDVALLGALREALDSLASNRYATAFRNSIRQDDYRWGKLNRLTLEHPLGATFSIPPAAGFPDLGPGLPGIPRDGGYETVNISAAFNPIADGPSDFSFSFGSARRLVMSPGHPSASGAGALGFNSIPGGSSGDPASPLYASQLASWLTVDYHRLAMSQGEVRRAEHVTELFQPPARGRGR
ncbi:MAG: penicillin acylase family protein [Myxococcota bacterium]